MPNFQVTIVHRHDKSFQRCVYINAASVEQAQHTVANDWTSWQVISVDLAEQDFGQESRYVGPKWSY